MSSTAVFTVELPVKGRPAILSLIRHLGGKVIEHDAQNENGLFADDRVIVAEPLAKEKKVGTIIRGLRIREGLTQKQLADMVGESQAHISEYENNARKVPRSKRAAFAKALHTVASDFVTPK
jgi:ribosome-binding protein aMBF1 (putative translation factor)